VNIAVLDDYFDQFVAYDQGSPVNAVNPQVLGR
jgi:hypothetical protein